MLKSRTVVVVVPAYNEERHIEEVLLTMPTFVDHVVVVDDASTDGTAARAAAAAAATEASVDVLRLRENRGVGSAITAGYRRALDHTSHPNDAVAVMAGDGQMSPGELARIVEPVVQGTADYVKGNRFAGASTLRDMPPLRWAGGHVLSWLTSAAIGETIRDSQCGFTAIGRRVLAAIDLEGVWHGYGYPNDLLSHVTSAGGRLAERPVKAVYRGEASGIGVRHVPRMLWLIARAYRRRLRRGAESLSPEWGQGAGGR